MFRGLQIPEDKGQSKGRKETDDKVNKGKTIFVPVDLQSTGGITAGLRPTRITNPQISVSGIANPRGQKLKTGTLFNDNNTCLVPVDLQSTGGITAGLRPARIINPQISVFGDCKSPKTKDKVKAGRKLTIM